MPFVVYDYNVAPFLSSIFLCHREILLTLTQTSPDLHIPVTADE